MLLGAVGELKRSKQLMVNISLSSPEDNRSEWAKEIDSDAYFSDERQQHNSSG